MTRSIQTFITGLVFAAVAILSACGGASAQSGTPEEFMKYYYDRLSVGDINAAMGVQTQEYINELGEREVREDVESQAKALQKDGGVDSFKYTFTELKNGRVQFQGALVMKNGKTYKNHIGRIIKINGKWYKE